MKTRGVNKQLFTRDMCSEYLRKSSSPVVEILRHPGHDNLSNY